MSSCGFFGINSIGDLLPDSSLAPCEQAEINSSIDNSLAAACPGATADTPGACGQTLTQLTGSTATATKAAVNVPVPDPGCTSFSDLSNYTAFSLQWWYCLQDTLENYAIWILAGLVALILLWAWASNGFK